MRIKALIFVVFFSLTLLGFSLSATAQPTVLILYDTQGPELPRLFLTNLLGHFNKTQTTLPVSEFNKALIEQYDTVFYFGTQYNQTLPVEFLNFVLTTSHTVVWFKYNLWQLDTIKSSLSERYGFHFLKLDHSGFNTVRYKDTLLTKNPLDKELGIISITRPEKTQILATAEKPGTQDSIPYIIRSSNFWYVADIPFSYIDEDDRYLAFADVLYDILKIQSTPKKRALIRLEDITPNYNLALLKTFSDYLAQEHIPFSISLIPYYKDPLNIYPQISTDLPITAAPIFVETLKQMLNQGGELILHGYTHQFDAQANPYLGISGADFEFMRVTIDPISFEQTKMETLEEDSLSWVTERIALAEGLLQQTGLHAPYWETPHYVASATDHQFFAQHFHANSGRIEYYDENAHHANQFFPYVIYKDSYGQIIIPENLGCYSPTPWYNHPKRDLTDLLNTARKNLVVRDAWASFYYHPYLGLEPLKTLIQGLKELGYEFVSIQSAITIS